MKEILNKLLENRQITEMNIRFAEFIAGLCKNKDSTFFFLMVLISSWTEKGHICLDLDNLSDEDIRSIIDTAGITLPQIEKIKAILNSSSCIGRPGETAPLILDENRLYFERFYSSEKELINRINLRIKKNIKFSEKTEKEIAGVLKGLFPVTNEIDWQAVAALTSLLKYFTVISGGPGTGKTTTVIKILILLIELNSKGLLHSPDKPLNIVLCAPTGKAAARLIEAIENSKKKINYSEEILALVPDEGYTIHRLLNNLSDKNNTPPDVIIIDEASMVDLSILARLLSSIPDLTRVILLGDKDQLASVEAGAVLGDICSGISEYKYSEAFYRNIGKFLKINIKAENNNQPDIRDSIVLLNKNYRFKGNLYSLSIAVNSGDTAKAFNILKSSNSEISWIDPEKNTMYRTILQKNLLGLYMEYIKETDIEKAFNIFDSFRVLCALRRGPFGVVTTNNWIEQILKNQGLINPYRRFYNNRPVLITKNDYNTGLLNGDIGIIRKDKKAEDNLYAFFKDGSGSFKKISPYKLPEHETVYSMTVHKSQGSEFEKVILILPDKPGPIITRELIYTGITRTKSDIQIISRESVLKYGISNFTKRTSGIYRALWNA
jgi:exodeoxyribonuclease V alpha subunit